VHWILSKLGTRFLYPTSIPLKPGPKGEVSIVSKRGFIDVLELPSVITDPRIGLEGDEFTPVQVSVNSPNQQGI
jgi:hypothetical protein